VSVVIVLPLQQDAQPSAMIGGKTAPTQTPELGGLSMWLPASLSI